MENFIIFSIKVVLVLVTGVLVAKYFILKFGRPINYTFSSFFWFSRWEVSNSSYQYSKRKRRLLNSLSISIVAILLLEIVVLLVTLIQELWRH